MRTLRAVEAPQVVPAGAGEVLGDAPGRRVELLSDRDPLHATWSRFGPGRAGADLHVHRRHTDLFFVLDGELTLRLGPSGAETVVPAGTLALVPPLVVHGFRNASARDVRYLNLHAPGRGFATYMRGLRDGDPVVYDQEDPPADGGRDPSAVRFAADGGASERPDGGVAVAPLAEAEDVAVRAVHAAPGAAYAPPTDGPPALDALHVLAGAVVLTASGHEARAPTGTWLHVASTASPRVEAGAGGARLLHVRTPLAPA